MYVRRTYVLWFENFFKSSSWIGNETRIGTSVERSGSPCLSQGIVEESGNQCFSQVLSEGSRNQCFSQRLVEESGSRTQFDLYVRTQNVRTLG